MPLSEADLLRYLHATAEEPNIDAKGPMLWDGGEQSAGLAKDIVALANKRDGGVLVIGKAERSGTFHLDGLTDDQAKSFDTTKVASWINSRFAPPINCVCHPLEYDHKKFVIITVQEFDDIPAICIKAFDPFLKKGSLFVRTANTASAPISSVEELRALIGMATRKHANQLLGMFQSVLRGHSAVEAESKGKEFDAEKKEVASWLTSISGTVEEGAWHFTIHPVQHRNRWSDVAELRNVIDQSAVHIDFDFPNIRHNFDVVEFGIANKHRQDAFCLTWNGLLIAIRKFTENRIEYDSPWGPDNDLPKGKWMEWRSSIRAFVEFFLFTSRYVEHFGIGENFSYEIASGPLNGRQLVSVEPLSGPPSKTCQAVWFKEAGIVSAEELRSSWQDMAAKAAHHFVQFFFADQIPLRTIANWVQSISQRE